MDSAPSSPSRPFAALRQLMPWRKLPAERCELCSAALPPEHQHLAEVGTRRLVCSCDACTLLFSGQASARYRQVPRDCHVLPDFQLNDLQWESLHIPINLAFFFRDSAAGRVVAMYPSPAGAVESFLPLESWHELEEANPILREFQPGVECLLVHRVGKTREHFRAPIDQCYKLVAVIRSNWHGLSGGVKVWEEIGRFFTTLRR
jgi:hypothetical protein